MILRALAGWTAFVAWTFGSTCYWWGREDGARRISERMRRTL